MNAIQSIVLWAGLAYGTAALAQTQPVTPANPSSNSLEQSMTKAEKIKQLKPATNYVELMQLLNTIHEQVLLTDPSFMEDANIHRLFGNGEIKTTAPPQSNWIVFKELMPNAGNPFQFRIRIAGTKRNFRSGSLTLGDYKPALPFNHELIEAYLLPGNQGSDPYDPTRFMTNEQRSIAGRLPLATHPKGYWTYVDSRLRSGYRNSVLAELDRNANVSIIALKQNEVDK